MPQNPKNSANKKAPLVAAAAGSAWQFGWGIQMKGKDRPLPFIFVHRENAESCMKTRVEQNLEIVEIAWRNPTPNGMDEGRRTQDIANMTSDL